MAPAARAVAVAASAICAETDAGGGAAGRQLPDGVRPAAPRRPDPGAAGREGARASSPRGEGCAAAAGRRLIVGSPATVRAGLEAVAAEYGADEVMIVTITHDHAARRRSYELIAEAFDLVAARPAEQIAS